MGVEDAIGSETELRRYALTVEDFLTLDRARVFDPTGRAELIEGEIYCLSPVYLPHSDACAEIVAQLRYQVRDLGTDLRAVTPASLQLGDYSMPEPDVLVLRWGQGRVIADPANTVIAIEVSASTLRHDLVRKAKLYAEHGIPEYWVVDLDGRQLHQLTDPTADGYATRDVVPFGARVVSKKVPEIALDTSAFG